VDPQGRHAVVIAEQHRRQTVALLLLQKGATVHHCHSGTAELGAMTLQADILVVAAGNPSSSRPAW